MTALAQPLPDDPEALKAMLLAERAAHAAETERLKHIIKELQRHRFGRRAESLPIDQLELALEEVQQGEAEDEAAAEAGDPQRRQAKAAKRRSNRGSLPAHLPRVAYVYAPDRTAERPIAHLDGFKGVLQVDGYGGYRKLAEKNEVSLAFCWSHVRRGFYELAAAGSAPIATEALERIGGLYVVEAEIRGRPADERRTERQARSRPILAALEPWLRAKLELVSKKSKLAEAIRYALARWEGLTRFLDDGRIEIDSNVVERAIRPLALGRKNHLFAGSDGGAEHWAVLASLIETCKLNSVDPQAYLADVISRIVQGHPQSDIDALLPWNHAQESATLAA